MKIGQGRNRLKEKNNMIILLDVEKEFNKIHHPCMIKVLERSGIQGAYVNIMKAVDSTPTTHKVNREKQHDSTKIRNKTRCPLSPYLLKVLVRTIRQQKEIKGV